MTRPCVTYILVKARSDGGFICHAVKPAENRSVSSRAGALRCQKRRKTIGLTVGTVMERGPLYPAQRPGGGDRRYASAMTPFACCPMSDTSIARPRRRKPPVAGGIAGRARQEDRSEDDRILRSASGSGLPTSSQVRRPACRRCSSCASLACRVTRPSSASPQAPRRHGETGSGPDRRHGGWARLRWRRALQ